MSTEGCVSETLYLDAGSTYSVSYMTTSQGINESVEVITSLSVVAYQPLLLNDDGTTSQVRVVFGSGDHVYNVHEESNVSQESEES